MPNLMITITLDPSMYVYKSTVQYNMIKDIIKEKLKKCKANYYLSFELTKKYNIHIHAYVIPARNYSNPHYYFTNLFRAKKGEKRIFGYTKIKDATNTQGCIDYINKDVSVTEQLLGVPVTITRLTDEQSEVLGIPIPIIERCRLDVKESVRLDKNVEDIFCQCGTKSIEDGLVLNAQNI